MTLINPSACMNTLKQIKYTECRSQWSRGLRRRSAAARLLRSWVRIPPVAWMFVCCECCVLSGRSLCDELLTRPVESYRLDRNLKNEEATAHFGPQRHGVGGNIGYTYGLSVLPAYQLRINKLKYTLTRICACCFTWA